MRTIEKASGRQAGSAASGIREWKVAPSFSTRSDPLVALPVFQSSTLTESLEQAMIEHLTNYPEHYIPTDDTCKNYTK